mmetsp:Transcript_27932/g.80511  ORF Transcript_27932/g.80511 Transcript_27932/m.80511 type:complete len:234 (-) Transcript_27932:1151-1852(-)
MDWNTRQHALEASCVVTGTPVASSSALAASSGPLPRPAPASVSSSYQSLFGNSKLSPTTTGLTCAVGCRACTTASRPTCCALLSVPFVTSHRTTASALVGSRRRSWKSSWSSVASMAISFCVSSCNMSFTNRADAVASTSLGSLMRMISGSPLLRGLSLFASRLRLPPGMRRSRPGLSARPGASAGPGASADDADEREEEPVDGLRFLFPGSRPEATDEREEPGVEARPLETL